MSTASRKQLKKDRREGIAEPHYKEPKRPPRRPHETKAERQARQAKARKADAAVMAKLPTAIIEAAIGRATAKIERTKEVGQ